MYLAGIARETGWSDRFILWRLPMAKGLGILHASGIAAGVAMKFDRGRKAERGTAETMREKFQRIKARRENAGPLLGE
jgi:hypothetical protein